MQTSTHLAAVLLCLATLSAAQDSTCNTATIPAMAAHTARLCFAHALVHSLHVAHVAAIPRDLARVSPYAPGLVSEMIADAQTRRRGLAQAAHMVTPWLAARDTIVSGTSEGMFVGYTELARIDSALERALETRLDQGSLKPQRLDSALIERLDKERGAAFFVMVSSVAYFDDDMTFYDPKLVGAKPTDARTLDMTRAERDALVEDIRRTFGAALRPPEDAFLTGFDRLARIMEQFFTQPIRLRDPSS